MNDHIIQEKVKIINLEKIKIIILVNIKIEIIQENSIIIIMKIENMKNQRRNNIMIMKKKTIN